MVVGDTFVAPSDGTLVARPLLLRVFWAGSQLADKSRRRYLGLSQSGWVADGLLLVQLVG
jgi:hypothetical protein